jgi:hypothetical protein
VPVAIETHLYSFWEKRIEKHGMAVEAAYNTLQRKKESSPDVEAAAFESLRARWTTYRALVEAVPDGVSPKSISIGREFCVERFGLEPWTDD